MSFSVTRRRLSRFLAEKLHLLPKKFESEKNESREKNNEPKLISTLLVEGFLNRFEETFFSFRILLEANRLQVLLLLGGRGN